MKGRQILLDHINGLEAAALLVDGLLEDLLIADPEGDPLGTIYAARVDRPLKGQGGVMVRLPGGRMGFLRRSQGLAPGQMCIVQSTGHAELGKAPPVTDRFLFKSRYAIVTPSAPGLNISRQIKDDDRRDSLAVLAKEGMDGSEAGLILRSSCSEADDTQIADDIATMRDTADQVTGSAPSEPAVLSSGDTPHLLAWREWADPAEVHTAPGCFEDLGVLDQIEACLGARCPLGQGCMYIEPTRALTAVDVNTGADTSPAAALKTNLAAAAALPRALRLRGLGGQITVDFAPMAKKDRRTLETAMRKAARSCSVQTEVIDWTPLGHLELKRQRERLPLTQVLKGWE